jgi:Glycosyltransferase 61
MAQWAKDLMHYANCTVVVSKDALPESETLSYAPPFNASLEIGSIWFDRPDHAAALKDAVLSRPEPNLESNHSTRSTTSPWTRTERLRIGLVIRPRRPHKANRAFVNQDEIVQALSNVFEQAILTIVDLGSLNMWQQAAFFASHDVVIAAHGAGLTNALFLRSDYTTPSNAATLIEVFPDDFESPMFRWLVAASGNARHVGMAYNNTAAPPSPGKDARHVDLRPNVPELVALVFDAVARQNTTQPYFLYHGNRGSRTTLASS